MVGAPAAADALRVAQRLPRLNLGLHVVLVDGAPVSPPEQIPDLVDTAGRLRSDLTRLAFEIASRRAVRQQLRREITAQFETYRDTGLPLEHVDVHKHFHLHPLVSREIIRIGLRYGMRALRVPAEPTRVIRRANDGRIGSSRLVSAWAEVLRAQASRHGLVTPDAVFGLHWSGGLTRDRMLRLLEQLPQGLIEIYLHPAASDTFPGHVPGYAYVEELKALRAPETLSALQRSGFNLGGYADAFQSDALRQEAPIAVRPAIHPP